MNLTDRALITQITATFDATSTKIPAALAAALTRAGRLAEQAQTLMPADGAIGVAITAAYDDGRDPAADPEVQRLVTATQLAGNYGLPDQIVGAATDQARQACAEAADQIVTTWAKAFDQAAATLTTAHQRIGPLQLDDTDPIMRLGGDAAAVWADATTAVRVIDSITGGWQALATFTRLLTPSRRHRTLTIADPTYDQWIEHRLDDAKPEPWTAQLTGLPLSLPTFTEYRGRVQAIDACIARARQEVEANAHDYMVGRRPAAERQPADRRAAVL